jgi:electron transport complex protein RnfC
MFGFKLLGNTRIPHRKNTAALPPVRMTPPSEILLPVEQHIGAPAIPVVKVGDTVKVGQLVAKEDGYVSSPIYSSVSGTVKKIETIMEANGRQVEAIRIESDGQMTVHEDIAPPEVTDAFSFIEAIRRSGVVGLGGAGFPTAVKFDALKKGGVHTIILNGAECEPYITSDARTMLDDAFWMVEGVALLQRFFPEVKKYIIGIEANKPECIRNMKQVFAGNPAVTVRSLPLRYPQGAEKVIIYNTTGLVVPEGKLPADIGVLVTNVNAGLHCQVHPNRYASRRALRHRRRKRDPIPHERLDSHRYVDA